MNYKDTLNMDKYETSEVSNMKWKTYEECKDSKENIIQKNKTCYIKLIICFHSIK